MWAAGIVLGLSVAGMCASTLGLTWSSHNRRAAKVELELSSGSIVVRNRVPPSPDSPFAGHGNLIGLSEAPPHWLWPERSRFVSIDSQSSGRTLWVAVLPLWMPTALAATVLGCVWHPGQIRTLRADRGHCPTCNYDLTGIDGVCPECGRPRP
jgi:hypothetical protein